MFKMLALEQSAEKWPYSAGGWGGGRPTAPTPLATGLLKFTTRLTFHEL